ncbi:hypothetical protein NVP1187O_140 [Vibrio phage 1.187.O._10N.286.49.F1]|nr:hypothetical protein NVP1187O_140 [Vibrio phage 1.187.O._10N.286.49.F1]
MFKDLQNNLPKELCHEYKDFKLDNRAKNSINKLLGTDFIAVYREIGAYDNQWKYNDIDCGAETVLLVKGCGTTIRMWNSEWAGFEEI